LLPSAYDSDKVSDGKGKGKDDWHLQEKNIVVI
jgi:hypothetical protein